MPENTEKRITLRVPAILATLVDGLVQERRARERKFSLNDWIVEAMREKDDGPMRAQHRESASAGDRMRVDDGGLSENDWESRVHAEFPKPVRATFAALYPREWNAANWEGRYKMLVAERERQKESGDA